MNAIKYFHNRFSYAIKTNGTIKVNQQDIEAINKLIEFEKTRNTDLEDALLLFYLFWGYTIENENNKLKLKEKPIEDIKFPLGINTPYNLLNNLSKLISPKEYIIDKIANEIWIYQEYERCCKDQDLRNKELEEIKNDGGNYFEDENSIKSFYVTKQETIPIDIKSTKKEIENILEDALKKAKEEFPMINALSKGVKWKS